MLLLAQISFLLDDIISAQCLREFKELSALFKRV